MIARTIDRVPANTDPEVNDAIRRMTEANIEYFSQHPEEIPARLRELDHEWDIERVLEAGSATLSLTGLIMSLFGRRRWLILPLAVQAFFLQHVVQGWCPPLPLLRRLGVRTADEIDWERDALEAVTQEQDDSSGDALHER